MWSALLERVIPSGPFPNELLSSLPSAVTDALSLRHVRFAEELSLKKNNPLKKKKKHTGKKNASTMH